MTWTEEDRALLERVDRARRQVAAPLESLRKNKDRTGRGQAVSLYSFLEEIGLPERLEERVEALIQRNSPALAEEYRQLWDILCGGLEQCARLLADSSMELEEFSLLFRLVLSQYDVGTIPVSLDRVAAGEVATGGVLFDPEEYAFMEMAGRKEQERHQRETEAALRALLHPEEGGHDHAGCGCGHHHHR